MKSGFSPKEALAIAQEQQKAEVDAEYTRQVNDLIDNKLEPMRQNIINNLLFTKDKDGNMIVDKYNSSKVKGLMGQVQAYNAYAKRVGYQPLDLNDVNSMASINKPDVKLTNGQNGVIYGYNAEDGTLKSMVNASKVNMQQLVNGRTLQVDGIGNIVRDLGINRDPKSNFINTPAGLYNVETGKIVAGTAKASTEQQQAMAQRIQSLSTSINAMRRAGMSEEDVHNTQEYQAYTDLMGFGGGKGQQQEQSQDQVAQRIDHLKYDLGWSKEQIINGLRQSGLQRYESWVPND